MQGKVLCINPKSAKYIICTRVMSVFECPDDSLDLKQDLFQPEVYELYDEIPTRVVAEFKARCDPEVVL